MKTCPTHNRWCSKTSVYLFL